MIRTKEEILNDIANAERNLTDLEDGNKTEEYDEWLDEITPPYKIGVCTFNASRVLKELDEIAYNYGYDDFVESERETYEGNINELQNELKEYEEEN